ncbi:MAG: transposase family protein [Candidatus Bathyarchaeia archaeon]
MAALFELSKTQTERVIKQQIQQVSSLYPKYFILEDIIECEKSHPNWPNHFGIIDSTEFEIQTWIPESYSGKSKKFSLKYQIIIGINSYRVYSIYGPVIGSIHDSTLLQQSGCEIFLNEENIKIIGDKGYQGYTNITTPIKKKEKKKPLTPLQQTFNKKVAHTRIRIENHFATIKKWKILSTIFRGDPQDHKYVFFSCEILHSILNQ